MTKQEVIEKVKKIGVYSLIINELKKQVYTEDEVKKIFAKAGIKNFYK